MLLPNSAANVANKTGINQQQLSYIDLEGEVVRLIKWLGLSLVAVIGVLAYFMFWADDFTAETLKDVLRKADIDYSQAEFDNRPWVDGTTPAETMVIIEPAPARADIIADLKRACASIGLGEPEPEHLRSEPTMICDRRGASSISVYAELTCKERCRLIVHTRAL